MARAKGFDMGLVLLLESPSHIKTFAEHPAHLRSVVIYFAFRLFPTPFGEVLLADFPTSRLHDMREAISEDSMAFMLETS